MTCVIFPFVRASEASTLDSDQWSQTCAQWLWWRGSASASHTWLRRCNRATWMRHLSTLTFIGSPGRSIEDAWTLCQADSHASRSQFPAPGNLLKTLDISGPISPKVSLFADLDSASSKMSTASRPQSLPATTRFSTMSSATWRAWVSERRLDSSRRRKLARRMSESGGSSWVWPTPDVTQRPHEGNVRLLRKGVERGMSKAQADAMLGRDISKPQGKLKQWSTPTTQDGSNNGGPSQHQRNSLPLNAQVSQSIQGQTKKSGNQQELLNPDWVDALMGFPIGWTDLEPWAMQWYQTAQPRPSQNSGTN